MLSSRKKNITWSDVRVGVFLLTGIAIVIFFVLFVKPEKIFTSTVYARSLFASVRGLAVGDPVMMSGVQIGSVTKISFIPPNKLSNITIDKSTVQKLKDLKNQMDHLNLQNHAQSQTYRKLQQRYRDLQSRLKHIVVLMSISKDNAPLIRADSVAMLFPQGIFGGQEVIAITPGTLNYPSLPFIPGAHHLEAIEIPSQESPSFNRIVAQTAGITNSLQQVTSEIASDVRHGKGTLGKLVKSQSVYDNFNKALKATAEATLYTGEMLHSIQEGKGTLGKFFTNPTLYNTATHVMVNIEKGKGTMGHLLKDPSLYNNMNGLIAKMNHLAVTANTKNGAVHQLLTNPSLYNNSSETFANAASLLKKINEGKGSLGQLANNKQFYQNASQAMASLAAVSKRLQNGQGSLGLLLKDKTLYNNITELSGQLAKFMKDFRKNPRKYLTVQFSVVKIF